MADKLGDSGGGVVRWVHSGLRISMLTGDVPREQQVVFSSSVGIPPARWMGGQGARPCGLRLNCGAREKG